MSRHTGAKASGLPPIPILLLSAAALSIAGCGHEAPLRAGAALPEVAAPVETARLQDVPDRLALTGTVQPQARVVVSAKVMARILSIHAREGSAVRAGQELVRLDDADLRAGVAQARAAVAAAKAAEENAAAHRERMLAMEARQSATRKNREDAEMAHGVAAARTRQAESALAASEAMLAYATLAAPVSGIVTRKDADEGNMAAPGMPILTIEETAVVKVEASLPESEAGTVGPGTPVTIEFDAGGLAARRAEISEILPSSDPATRSLLVRVRMENADGSLRTGLFARVLVERSARKVLTVPRRALVERGALTGLYAAVAEEGRTVARLRWIRPGRAEGDRVEVLGGLAEGELYVADAAAPSLADGSPLAAAR